MRFLLSLSLVFTFLFAQAQTLRFQQTIGNKDAEAHSVLKTKGGGYLLAGQSWNNLNTDYDVFLTKLDSLGNIIWKKSYGDTMVYEWETDVQHTIDGGYILTGQSFDLNTFLSNTFVIKTDSLGTILWHKSFGGSFNKVVPANNGYLLAGVVSTIGAGNNDFYLLKIDFNGNVQWTRTHGGAMVDVLNVAIPYKNGWILGGSSNSNTTGISDNYFIQTDSVGNSIYEYAIGDTTEDLAIAAIKKNNGFYIAGRVDIYDTIGIKHRAIELYQVNDSFNVVWQKTLLSGFHIDVHKIIQAKTDGGIVICGTKYEADTLPGDGFIIKTDSLGQVQWAETYGGTEEDAFFDIQEMNDSGFAATGFSKSFSATSYNNIYLAKTDIGGNSFCNHSPMNIIENTSNYSMAVKHFATDTGLIVTTNNFIVDTISGNNVLCSSFASSVQTSLKDIKFQLYPNPAKGNIQIYTDLKGVFSLVDLNGKIVLEQAFEAGKQEISVNVFDNGIYFWNMIDKEGVLISRGKLIVMN